MDGMKPSKVSYSPENLREIRKRRGMTQLDLAEKSRVAVNTIRLLEANKMIPGEEVLMNLGEALNVLFVADWENRRPLPQRKGREDR